MRNYGQIMAFSGALIAAALIAACGGGGGGGGAIQNPGGGSHPSPSPSPSPTPPLNGSMQVAAGGPYPTFTTVPAANANVVFSCGCSTQAGTAVTDGSGAFSAPNTSPATPAPPALYTTVPGRNYLIVGKTSGGAEAWTLQFLGNTASHDHFLEGTNASDVYTAAAALYVFQNSSGSSTAFDDWDFTSVATWVANLKSSANSPEQKLLSDIASESALNHTLFPSKPQWGQSQTTNAKIATDLANVKTSGDTTLPVDCGVNPCGAEPTP